MALPRMGNTPTILILKALFLAIRTKIIENAAIKNRQTMSTGVAAYSPKIFPLVQDKPQSAIEMISTIYSTVCSDLFMQQFGRINNEFKRMMWSQ